MKKRIYFILISIILSIFLISLVSSLDPLSGATDSISDAQNTFEKIPKTPEEIKAQYLKQEWNKIFMNIPVIGPIHTFFLAHSLPFKILLNEPYSISLTFILILIMWIITAKLVYKPAKEAFNGIVAWTLALGVPLIFAHISLYKIVTSKLLYLVFAEQSYWMRTIIWFLVAFAVIILLMVDEILRKMIKKKKEEERLKNIEQKMKKSETYLEGLNEYLKIVKRRWF